MATNQKLVAIGNYEVSSLSIGEGSFSKVKIARHKVLEKNVAIKIIRTNTIKDRYVSRNLEREAKILSTLIHNNVVRLFEVTRCDGFYCLIMEYFPGGSLCDMIQNNGKLEESIAKQLFGQLIIGLNYIHGKGIVHRDLKLENLLLSKDLSNLVIADFGLSNFWSQGNVLNTYCGSPEYAAPELFDKTVYTQKVDVWSAGIILYAMLTAQLPFDVNQSVKCRISALIKLVNLGLGSRHRIKLLHCSLELKLLLHMMLRVNPEKRIDVGGILADPWITEQGESPLQETQELTLSEEETQIILDKCKLKLTLTKISTEQILTHIRSEKGWLGKTAGCFNILRRELEKTRDSPGARVQPVCVKEPVFKPTDNLKLLADDSNKMFWDSTPGKRALQALKKINPSSTQIHSPQSKIRRTGEQQGTGLEKSLSKHLNGKGKQGEGGLCHQYVSGNLDKENLTCFKTGENYHRPPLKKDLIKEAAIKDLASWRRSLRPQAQGEEKSTRLKRVDWGEKEPLKTWDMNRIH